MKYLFQGTYTAEGIKGLMKEGGSKRREAAEQLFKSAGGHLDWFYYAYGDIDVFGVVDFPDQASAVAVSGAINASGTTTMKLIPLITIEEIDEAAKKSLQYRAPGR